MDETRNPQELESHSPQNLGSRDSSELKKEPSDRKSRTEMLLEKRRALDEKIQKATQRDAAKARSVRNRGLLLIGVAIEKLIGKDSSNKKLVRDLAAENLKEREREAVNRFIDTLPG